jgi:hypothetical protein
MTNCDYCETFFESADLFNVDYLDGFANVLCANCVDVSHKINPDRIEGVWQ